MSLFQLNGKRALVTGGSRGIGLAAAHDLIRLGAQVTLAARNEDVLRRAADAIGARWVVADVSTPDGVRAAVEAAGQVDILVSNAGGPPPAQPSAVTEEGWGQGFQTTFMSTARLAAAVLPGMRERRWGRIIAVTSLTVGRPALNLPVSNAMRAAVTNHLRTLALEVAADGVTCNTVAPGYTATERLNALHADPADAERLKGRIPARRFGEPNEVGAAVAFLATKEAAYITGQEILVDGGWSI
ncbi:SDR family oxidoreductase [Deinococcus soli (ex Cha et al. 2016)]|uniref:3-oxoacyl-[acyl-carrier protein] reductase n=2 Tax=Deinococcus soli (ex Cha et al. 2016) TaxID=1309411 RepID=A0ACC6KMN6_9DEIO|nr:SDR family oxidoreductase [Deinococcus soli (ex Cha et al. 2016)]MDR6220750.1 3-oxoacyl-[acyl-carrier protein] reductase [Deinococcus soli (ex Cha et al. 2016)]MDR6330723.1 3-oxoacyl-[acyl-carrier protein] reductase [Deinococcus soli (ex Cha et al. 2016)]MDR6753765.1 3-oxoacyl-[acyl-carrier protein] reductase [Deinococcus soli (ex Cha et al. 2016)]